MIFDRKLVSFVLSVACSLTLCQGHGLIEFPASRNQFCGVVTKPDQFWSGNAQYPECFDAFDFATSQTEAYQFMSVLSNGPGRIGDNPLPANVCGYDSNQFSGGITPWDAYGVDWPTNDMSPGRNEFRWNIQWGSHFGDTKEFSHWITKADFQYNPDRPLEWTDFEEAPFCVLDYNHASPDANPNVIALTDIAKFETFCDVPVRTGRHVIYAEWGRRPPSSDERFHVEFGGEVNPTQPAPTQLPTAAPAASPTNPPVTSSPVPNPTNPIPFPTLAPVPSPSLAPLSAPTQAPIPVSDPEDCAIEIQDGQNAWFAGLMVGFDTQTITLDFSGTGFNLEDISLQQGVFTSATINGDTITLTKPGWVSKQTKGWMGLNGNGGVDALATLEAPSCVKDVSI